MAKKGKGKNVVDKAVDALTGSNKPRSRTGTSTSAKKANETKAKKAGAAAAAADAIKSNGRVDAAKVAGFIERFGEKVAKAHFSKMQVSRAKKRVQRGTFKDVSAPVKTPTGTKTKRAKPVNEQSKASMRQEAIEGAKKRPQNATTTVIGKGASSDVKPDQKRLRAARAESERREPASEFESRLNKYATQGGVENLGQRGKAINEHDKPKHEFTGQGQAGEMMRSPVKDGDAKLERETTKLLNAAKGKKGDKTAKQIEEERRKASQEKAKKLREKRKNASKKKSGGKVVRRKSGGPIGRGMGKALRGGGKVVK